MLARVSNPGRAFGMGILQLAVNCLITPLNLFLKVNQVVEYLLSVGQLLNKCYYFLLTRQPVAKVVSDSQFRLTGKL